MGAVSEVVSELESIVHDLEDTPDADNLSEAISTLEYSASTLRTQADELDQLAAALQSAADILN